MPNPGVPDMQVVQSLLAALGPSAIAILSSMQAGVPIHHVPQHAPQPPLAALSPPPPVIDPQLEQPSNAFNQVVLQRLETLEKSLKRPQHNENDEADDEGDGGAIRQSKKPRKDSKFILNIRTDQLMPAQKKSGLNSRYVLIVYMR